MKKNVFRGLALLLALCCYLGCTATALAADSWVAVSMDANTLGLGFLIEPTMVNISEQPKASMAITALLKAKIAGVAQPWQMTGNVEDSFYLSQVYCPNQANATVADYILKTLQEKGSAPDYGSRSDAWLGEFDYYSMSGWMYSVNSRFPNVGAASYTLENGDVMRWQFTVYGYGSDLNADNSAWGSESIVHSGSKDDLTWLVAYLNGRFEKAALNQSEAYRAAVTVLQDPEAAQAELDAAFDKLVVAFALYQDLTVDADALAAINRLTAWHLLNGTGAGKFEPDMRMTKAMFLSVLYRMADSPAASANAAPHLSAWAKPAVAWAAEAGLISSGDAAALTMADTASVSDCVNWANQYLSLVEKSDAKVSAADGAAKTISRAEAARILADVQTAAKTVTQ